ncbi:hypothetical protein [Terriglobus roseus]|uniref:SmpA / OmlA family protein n=1 Tax=Terriglobus roseus TaxID=392734 RepID=A0A1G7NB79_9BACT|nr:hypothetical protein [Terriglobus roseus]SDF71212.1 hypothetical protein SAMN05444167_3078 [Terriglobus roseus]
MSFRRLSFALLFAIGLIAPVAWSQTLIRVYVQAGSGDFAANGASDSALDLRKALLGKSQSLTVVDSAADADVVARVDSRNVRKETSAVNTYSNKSDDGKSTTKTTVPTVQTINELHVTLLVGNSEIPMQSESSLSWRLAASNMASSIEHWTKENSAKLMGRRGAASASQAPAAVAAPGPVATQDASIAPGMTEADVLKAVGAPDKKVSFGSKAQWSYRGMQVVFEDGKVTDVKF